MPLFSPVANHNQAAIWVGEAMYQRLQGVSTEERKPLIFNDGIAFRYGGNLDPYAIGATKLVQTATARVTDFGSGVKKIGLTEMAVQRDGFQTLLQATGFSLDFVAINRALRAAMYNEGVDLIGSLSVEVDQAFREAYNQILAYGRPDLGMPGFYDNPDIPVEAAGIDLLDPATTDKQIIDFFVDTFWDQIDATESTYPFDTCLLEPKLYQRVCYVDQNMERSLHDAIMTSTKNRLFFVESTEASSKNLQAKGISGSDLSRVVFYSSAPKVIDSSKSPLITVPGTGQFHNGEVTYLYCQNFCQTRVHHPDAFKILSYTGSEP